LYRLTLLNNVIASEAYRTTCPMNLALDCFVANAPRNDRILANAPRNDGILEFLKIISKSGLGLETA